MDPRVRRKDDDGILEDDDGFLEDDDGFLEDDCDNDFKMLRQLLF